MVCHLLLPFMTAADTNPASATALPRPKCWKPRQSIIHSRVREACMCILLLIHQYSIFAVHGLNPRSKNDVDHAWDTWRTPSGSDGHLWLRDDLPRHLPQARIFLYEYNATAVYGKDRDTFIGKANELLEAIRVDREDEQRPILLFGHSMGGLLIKQALINAHNNPKYIPIKDATTGLAFFATPHHGGDWRLVSLGSVVSKIATKAGFQKGDDILETLKSGSIFSDIMHEHWRHQLMQYDIISFWGSEDNASDSLTTAHCHSDQTPSGCASG
jgi:pimeloyl-ACP methyl ester carboxylesterase